MAIAVNENRLSLQERDWSPEFQENKLLLGEMRELCGWLTLLLSGIDPVCQKGADALNLKFIFFPCFFYP